MEMPTVALFGAVLGLGLAQRFSAFVLAPVILVAAAAAAVAEFVTDLSQFQILLNTIIFVTGLQLGFFAGVLVGNNFGNRPRETSRGAARAPRYDGSSKSTADAASCPADNFRTYHKLD
jgi:hypothetical protein